MPPSTRSAGFVFHYDPGTIPSMRERIYPLFEIELISTLGDVVEKVIETVRAMLVPLALDHVPYDNIMGGLDSEFMANALTAHLVDSMTGSGIFYSFDAGNATYWKWVNFGHFVQTKEGPKWWEGYHFFEKAIRANEQEIYKAARLAWSRAASKARSSNALVGRVSPLLIAALSQSEQGNGG